MPAGFLFCCRESETILDNNTETAAATIENEEPNQQANQIRQSEIDNADIHPTLDDRSFNDDLQHLPAGNESPIESLNFLCQEVARQSL